MLTLGDLPKKGWVPPSLKAHTQLLPSLFVNSLEVQDRRDQKRASPPLGLSGVAGNAETTISDWDKPGSIPRPGSPSRPADIL